MEWTILTVLPEEARRDLLSRARRRRFRKGEVVFHEGDPGDALHLVDKGHLVVQRSTPLGDMATVRALGPGDVFGELAVVAPAPRVATVMAVDPAETLAVHRDVFDELRSAHPIVDRLLVHALADEVRRLSARLLEALYISSDKRIYLRLLEMARLFGTADGGAAIAIPLTQEQLAQMAGTTRPTANRVLRSAEAEGCVRMTRGRIEVLDLAAVVRHAR
ncbi:MAG: Crp/Fnr family transcriptional regulator [Acidimicrobiales bacterium]